MSSAITPTPIDPAIRALLAVEDVLRFFHGEESLLRLRDALLSERGQERPEGRPGRPWYESNPGRLRRELEILRERLEPDGSSALLGIDNDGRVAAIGRVRSGVPGRPRLAVVMPEGYPDTPPAVYAFNRNSPVELPLDLGRHWTSHDDTELALRRACEFLRERIGGGEGGSDGSS